ncbi:MAG: elongation factor 1-beta [Archaeoglobaceae archaeon]
MGRVFVKIKVMPIDIDVDLNAINKKILELNFPGVELRDVAIKPVAFGLKSLNILAIMPDTEGVVDNFIAKIGKIEGVESVEIEDMELL